MRDKVSFDSHGSKIFGDLYYPDKKSDLSPGIIMCHGFAGVKEMLLPAYAKRFADHGYIVLTFDYRGFGESEGEPGRLDPKLQIEDIHNAINFFTGIDGVDISRVGLWGTSYGGANAVLAASNTDKIKALCVQLTFANGHRVVTGGMSEEELSKFNATLDKMRDRKEKTGKELMMPIVKLLTDPQSREFYINNSDKFEELNIKIPFLHIAETMKHIPEDVVDKINVPIMIVGAEKDGVNPIEETQFLFDKAKEPKELLIISKATHYEVYSGHFFEEVIEKELDFFDKNL